MHTDRARIVTRRQVLAALAAAVGSASEYAAGAGSAARSRVGVAVTRRAWQSPDRRRDNRPAPSAPGRGASRPLRLLTLNVWGLPLVAPDLERRMDAIGRQLAAMDLDIVGLQEAWTAGELGPGPKGAYGPLGLQVVD